MYPGWWGRWVAGWRAIPGTTHPPSQGPIFSIFRARGPTYGQMKAILRLVMRFLRIDLRIDLRMYPE